MTTPSASSSSISCPVKHNDDIVNEPKLSMPQPRIPAGGALDDIMREHILSKGGMESSLIVQHITQSIHSKTALTWIVILSSFAVGYNISVTNTLTNSLMGILGFCQYDPGDSRGRQRICNPVTLECPNGCSNPDLFVPLWLAIAFFAAAFGAVLNSWTTRQGRRLSIIASMITMIIGCMTQGVASSPGSYLWGRFLTGVSIGYASMATSTFLTELTPPFQRGFYGLVNQLSITAGILCAILPGLIFIQSIDSDLMIQAIITVMLLFPIVPAIIVMIMLQFIFKFETPQYYIARQDLPNAKAVVSLMYRTYDEAEIIDIVNGIEGETIRARTQGHLFDIVNRKVLITICSIGLCQQVTGINIFTSGSAVVLTRLGLTRSNAIIWSAAIGGANVLTTLFTFPLLNRIKSRKIMLTISILGQFTGLSICTVFAWMNVTDQKIHLVPAGLLVMVVFFAVGYGPVLWAFFYEVMPASLTTKGSTLGLFINWLTAGILVLCTGLTTPTYLLTVSCGLSLVCLLITYWLISEPKSSDLDR